MKFQLSLFIVEDVGGNHTKDYEMLYKIKEYFE